MSYDRACYSLAEHFLSDEQGVDEEDLDSLAESIQKRIEDFLNFEFPMTKQRRAK